MKYSTYLHESQAFYQKFFSMDTQLSHDNAERYEVIFSLIQDLNLPVESSVLDIGGGDGRIASFLRVKFNQVTTVDITCTPVMRKILADCPEINFSIGALPYLPLVHNGFDLIVFSEVLEHLPAEFQQDVIQRLKYFLRPGGYLVLSTPNPASLLELVRKPVSQILRSTEIRQGQLLENHVRPTVLESWIRPHFDIVTRLGSFFLFMPFTFFASRVPLLYRVSDSIRQYGWLKTRGLYQYYVLQRP